MTILFHWLVTDHTLFCYALFYSLNKRTNLKNSIQLNRRSNIIIFVCQRRSIKNKIIMVTIIAV